MSVEERVSELEERVSRLERELEELRAKLAGRGAALAKPSLLDSIREELSRVSEEYEEGFVLIASVLSVGGSEARCELVSSPSDALRVHPKRVAMFSEALSSEARVAILRALCGGPKTARELSQATGLEGGQLYHHLRVLLQSRFISAKRRGEYRITGSGLQALMAASLMASFVVPPLEEEVEELVGR